MNQEQQITTELIPLIGRVLVSRTQAYVGESVSVSLKTGEDGQSDKKVHVVRALTSSRADS